MTGAEVLALTLAPLAAEDSGATTIRGYLRALLRALWSETSDFSGKRPFGNSGWDWDLLLTLVVHGAIVGALDEDGYLDSLDDEQEAAGRALIATAMDALAGEGDAPTP